jgi:hypothetical protein
MSSASHTVFGNINPPSDHDRSRTVVGIAIKVIVTFLTALAVLRYLPVKKAGEKRFVPFGEDAVMALAISILVGVVDYFDPEIMKFARKLCGQVMESSGGRVPVAPLAGGALSPSSNAHMMGY